MALLGSFELALLSSIAILLYGLFIEKFFVSKYTAFTNIIALLLGMASFNNLSKEIILGFAVFSLLCTFLVFAGGSTLRKLVGSKVVGATLLTLTLIDYRRISVSPADSNSVVQWCVGAVVATLVAGYVIAHYSGAEVLG